ncbi:hypothetical protein A2767_04775 [Candidatus Roizmanbacteria bacterium RIFCSPHIGHO2_01_FULL_35_10]|uniref:Uncharacterized protein n=1 Tax=Candidatus Roizmanbacteria bacterium RIFCSPLOWO2_01_FULL_35_13 TaxID=1802055 RepID=A0A1F7IAC9_9BACT|nr:MAG: hypothetical protein A2767_04775 [Candidatus Roizmanbacteria bacterium RIFCSPHIGHO2_01_FULL_35_10]OGK40282.1 MAG: hypothetical protein A3A74_07290 [Candidatus Roizmanbacteria bacterium RIFCSPLOWO2_01_FULL_35_13]
MKQLEKKILKKIYFFETQQTFLQLFLRILAMVSFFLAGIIWIYYIVQELIYQQTLDIFEIFREDLMIIRENFWEVIGIFTEESPILEIMLAIGTLVISVYLIVKFIVNFVKIKNKLNSLIKFWFAR